MSGEHRDRPSVAAEAHREEDTIPFSNDPPLRVSFFVSTLSLSFLAFRQFMMPSGTLGNDVHSRAETNPRVQEMHQTPPLQGTPLDPFDLHLQKTINARSTFTAPFRPNFVHLVSNRTRQPQCRIGTKQPT